MSNPQATLPTFESFGDRLLATSEAQRVNIDPPKIVTLTGNADVVFDARPESGTGDRKVYATLILHHLGSDPLKYAVNQDVSDDSFHDILPGGTSDNDGTGPQVDFSKMQVNYLTVKGTSGEKVSVIVSYPLSVELS